MDIDLFKSVSEDEQMDMLMMMQMGEKLPEYGGPHGGGDAEYSGEEFSGSSGGRFCNLPPHATQNPPAFMNLPSTISFGGGAGRLDAGPADRPFLPHSNTFASASQKRSSMAAMREMIFRIAVMQPIQIDPEAVKPPKRRNVKISKDPQSVAARHRRERISERIRILQRLVPGGTKMDTASMLDEAIHYVKFLKSQVQSLERVAVNRPTNMTGVGFPVAMSNGSYIGKANYQAGAQIVQQQQQYCDAN